MEQEVKRNYITEAETEKMRIDEQMKLDEKEISFLQHLDPLDYIAVDIRSRIKEDKRFGFFLLGCLTFWEKKRKQMKTCFADDYFEAAGFAIADILDKKNE